MPLQRLPNWIQIGAFLLALNAGMVNVLGKRPLNTPYEFVL